MIYRVVSNRSKIRYLSHGQHTAGLTNDNGAGPRTTLPSALYCEPWHGHLNLFSACVDKQMYCEPWHGHINLFSACVDKQMYCEPWHGHINLFSACVDKQSSTYSLCSLQRSNFSLLWAVARALINLFFPCIDKQSSTHSLRDVRRCNFIFGPEGVFEETYRHPRHHTAQVRADGVDPILLDARAGGVGYQVGGVSLVIATRKVKFRFYIYWCMTIGSQGPTKNISF